MFTYTITAYNKYGRPMAVETQVTDHWQATELCCDMSMVYATQRSSTTISKLTRVTMVTDPKH